MTDQLSEQEFADLIGDMLYENLEDYADGHEDLGIENIAEKRHVYLSDDAGIVIKLTDGQKFIVTVQRG